MVPSIAQNMVDQLPEVFQDAKEACKAATAAKRAAPVQSKVAIFEVAGGTDKGPDGHRIDTPSIVKALEARGAHVEVLFYSDSTRAALFEHCVSSGVQAYVMRVNPGCFYADFTDTAFMDMGRDLHAAGVLAVQHPDIMMAYDPKDTLYKLRDTPVGLPDTGCYDTRDAFWQEFPARLAETDRVLKQNRGCTGEGVWVVRPHVWERTAGEVPGLDALVEATEMVDNTRRVVALREFMEDAAKLLDAEYGCLVDQRFLPRISEGEVRVFMIHDRPVCVLHKKPAEGSVSATLFSGAKYTSDEPDEPKWQPLLDMWKATLPQVRDLVGAPEYPLFWCADFILDTDSDGQDAYRLGEMNASCVGFSTVKSVADDIASAVVSLAHKEQ